LIAIISQDGFNDNEFTRWSSKNVMIVNSPNNPRFTGNEFNRWLKKLMIVNSLDDQIYNDNELTRWLKVFVAHRSQK